ncbi:MAG TPA: polysaccharide biosynthesis C-terminal domain-containing protein [Rhodanobacteraceae bacterium]|nr:polysaccharide biosynthesis C-terminal domain-containing protein [Rhodanobacteraceae bacterium]
MSTRSQTLRNTLFSSVGLYTEYGLGVLTSIIIARDLEPAGYGVYVAIVWLAGLGIAATNSGTASAAIKFIAELRGAGRHGAIVSLVHYLRRIEFAFYVALMAVGGLLFWYDGAAFSGGMDPRLVFALIVVSVGLRAPYMFDIGTLKGFENFAATARVAAVATPCNLLLMMTAWLLHLPVLGFLVAYLLSGVVFRLMVRHEVTRMLAPLGPGATLPEELRRRIRRHIRIAAGTVTITFLSARDVEVMFLTRFASSADAGFYKVAYQLATGAALLAPGVFGAILLPLMAKALSQGSAIAARRFVASSSYLFLLAAPLIVFGVLFSADVIHVLYGPAFAAAAPVLAVLIVVCCIGSVGAAGSSLLVSADRQHNILLVTLAIGALKLGLDWWLIRLHGLHGAVMASAIAGVVGTVSILSLAARSVDTGLDWPRLARMALAALLAAALAWPLTALPPLASLIFGSGVLVLGYAVGTLLLGCWSAADLDYFATLCDRLPGLSRPLRRLLAWAGARARESV